MRQSIFWRLLEDILSLGDFIAAVPNDGASANIVGHLRLGLDGSESVIEKEVCHCHIHLKPSEIAAFSFSYLDVGFGDEPCVEFLSADRQPVVKLYYRGGDAPRQFRKLVKRDAEYQDFIAGSW